jgi:Mg2+-importing ATPase
MALVPIAIAIPYLPGAAVLGFTPLPFGVLGGILLITGAYVAATEVQKRWFYREAAPSLTPAGHAPVP